MSDTGDTTRCPSNIETVFGALAALALGNLSIVLSTGGYDFVVLGLRVRATTPGRPLAILLALLAVRASITLRRTGLGRSLVGALSLGLPAVVAAGALFYVAQGGRAPGIPAWAAAAVWGMGLAAFVVAWLSWPPPPGAARFVVVAIYIGGNWALAASLGATANWERTFRLVEPRFAPGVSVPAERTGLLDGEGTGVTFEKVRAGLDWRDAAAVKPGGFFSKKISWAAPCALTFALARSADAAGATAKATFVGDHAGVCFEKEAGEIPVDSWERVTIPLEGSGEAEVEFELAGESGSGAVLFANPRIAPATAAGGRLNVILIVVDALRADHMGLYGYGKRTTTELEAAAQSGVVFDGSLAQSPWTLPSMAGIFTSLSPSAHGVTDTQCGLSARLPTLALRLRAAGYRTAAFQANALLAPEAGFAHGFESYFHYPTRRPTVLDPGRYVRAAEINRDALAWIEKADRPFFLYLHYMDVHDPYAPPKEFHLFPEDASGLYDGEIAYFSSEFAAFFAALGEMGLLDSTMIVFTSDHGEQFLEHGATKHGNSLYSEEVGVPLVIWHPQAAPRRTGTASRGIDVAPTVLDAAGAEGLANAEGRSLMTAVKGGDLEGLGVYSELYTIYPRGSHLVSLTDGAIRLIVTNPGTSTSLRLELYDLSADPDERTNLAASRPDLLDAMQPKVEAFADAEKALHARLVPEEIVLQISQERLRELEALGYVNK